MKVTPQRIQEVLLLEPKAFGDERGYFKETYSTRSFPGAPPVQFVQDNVSFSTRGILRGLHLQHPHDQGKLVMSVTGAIWDVAVDVRVGSPTFGQWVAAELSETNHHQFYVPPGFAHGFCVLSETAHVLYKCTDVYHPDCEVGIAFDDADIGVKWPIESPLVSDKDRKAPRLADIPADKLPKMKANT